MKLDRTDFISGNFEKLKLPKRGSDPGGVGQIVVSGTNISMYNGQEYEDVLRIIDPLFDFSSHLFTNAGKTGRTGPTLAQCVSAYSGASFLANHFSVTGGIQNFVVPVSGRYRLTAIGATGNPDGGEKRYRQARITGTFDLVQGDILRILVGQFGLGATGWTSGGGGGTFVWSEALQDFLVVAGGCGGCFYNTSIASLTQAASNSITGKGAVVAVPANTNLKHAGANDSHLLSAKSLYIWAGAGSGVDQDAPAFDNPLGIPAKSFHNGGEGGTGYQRINNTYAATPSHGGFGGGGGGGVASQSSTVIQGQGGGGGYTGGNAAAGDHYGFGVCAASGGSFIHPTALTQGAENLAATTATHGSMHLELISS